MADRIIEEKILRGHRCLIKQGAKQCGHLMISVMEEDKSERTPCISEEEQMVAFRRDGLWHPWVLREC